MQAGKLDRRITFQSLTRNRDTYGAEVASWANIAIAPTVWANVMELKGKEKFEAAQITSFADLRIRIRFRSDLNERLRISYQSRFYDIHSITEMGRKDGLEILAQSIPVT